MLYVLACIYVILSCSGLILFKLGSSAGLSIGFSQGFLNMKLSGLSLLGMLCYITSFLLYLVLVSKFDLGRIYPITTGVIFVGVMIASAVVLHENISWVQIIGSALILIGVVMLSLKR